MQTEWKQEGFTITTDGERFDLETIHRFLSQESYWAQGRPIHVVRKAIRNSVVCDHPGLQGLRRWILATRDAHTLYARYGFTPLSSSGRFMERFVDRPDYAAVLPED